MFNYKCVTVLILFGEVLCGDSFNGERVVTSAIPTVIQTATDGEHVCATAQRNLRRQALHVSFPTDELNIKRHNLTDSKPSGFAMFHRSGQHRAVETVTHEGTACAGQHIRNGVKFVCSRPLTCLAHACVAERI
jgi:hypothetical protein